MTQTQKRVWAVGIPVVLIIVAAFVFWQNKRVAQPSAKPKQATTQQIQKVIQPTFASNGQLSTFFPKDLLIGTKPIIIQSYSLPYGSKSQSVTAYLAQDTTDKVFKAYLAYCQSNHYEIINQQQSAKSNTIYAIRNDGEISVTIVPYNSQSQVNTSYMER